MDSREIIKRTIDFKNPERLGVAFPHETDIISFGVYFKTYATDWEKTKSKEWHKKDQWGNIWKRCDDTSKGEVEKGVLEGIDNIEDYVFPEFYDNEKYNKRIRELKNEYPDKYLLGRLPGGVFSIARKMYRLDNYFIKLMLEREKINLLHDKIEYMLLRIIECYGNAGANGIVFAEDWGTQKQLLISPAVWEEEFYPRFERLCKKAHERGMKVFMHSCGAIGEIMPLLIKAGVDVYQFDQPDLHGIDTLAKYQENAKVTFWCPVDIQYTLQSRDEKIIRDKANEMLDKLWKGRGGFIGKYYGDDKSIGLDPKWQMIACDEFIKKGIAKRYT